MSDSLKVLGQSAPPAGALTALYTVPSYCSATVSSLLVCNTGGGAAKFRVSVAPNSAADGLKQYLYYDEALPANRTFAATLGLTLDEGDILRVQSDTGSVSFNVFGVEVAE